MSHTASNTIAALGLALLLTAPASAWAQAETAAIPQGSGPIEFVSGGVSETELAKMREQAPNYNLKVATATPAGAYFGGADVTVTDADGKQILSTRAKGPLLYARVPEGRYVVAAKSGSQVEEKTIRVGSGASPEFVLTLAVPESRAVAKSVAPAPAAETGTASKPAAPKPAAPAPAPASSDTRAAAKAAAPAPGAQKGAQAKAVAAKSDAAADTAAPKADSSARARKEDQGVSLYDLDPAAAKAKAQVNRYEVSPDDAQGAAPSAAAHPRSVDAISEAVNPAEPAPANEPQAAAATKAAPVPAPRPGARPR